MDGGKTRQAKRLLQACNDVNEEAVYFGNALAAAIASRKLALVELIIDAGADLNIRGRFGLPLRAAVVAKQLNIVNYLLDNGADPNPEDQKLGDPLQAAASIENLEIVLLLLTYRASVEGHGGHLGNALQAAAFCGHEQAVQLLISHSAKLDYEGYHSGRYYNALQAALYAGHDGIVAVLLGAGALLNPSVSDTSYFGVDRDRKALSRLRTKIKRLDILDVLAPLDVAASRGNIALVKMLLTMGAEIDPNVKG